MKTLRFCFFVNIGFLRLLLIEVDCSFVMSVFLEEEVYGKFIFVYFDEISSCFRLAKSVVIIETTPS